MCSVISSMATTAPVIRPESFSTGAPDKVIVVVVPSNLSISIIAPLISRPCNSTCQPANPAPLVPRFQDGRLYIC